MTKEKIYFDFAAEFTDAPGGRYRKDGDHSGEEFREDFLLPLYYMAKRHNKKLVIDFSRVYGFPASFLDESLGYLARYERENNGIDISKRIEFVGPPELKDFFNRFFRP